MMFVILLMKNVATAVRVNEGGGGGRRQRREENV